MPSLDQVKPASVDKRCKLIVDSFFPLVLHIGERARDTDHRQDPKNQSDRVSGPATRSSVSDKR
jgi:hypothetical protein